jgi:hypothetical protein
VLPLVPPSEAMLQSLGQALPPLLMGKCRPGKRPVAHLSAPVADLVGTVLVALPACVAVATAVTSWRSEVRPLGLGLELRPLSPKQRRTCPLPTLLRAQRLPLLPHGRLLPQPASAGSLFQWPTAGVRAEPLSQGAVLQQGPHCWQLPEDEPHRGCRHLLSKQEL